MLELYGEGQRWDDLARYSQSSILRMLRKGDWKLVYNMQGNGKMYHLSEDPAEVNNLYHDKKISG